jgi:peptidyl-prolyl cis-trans isomerase A (cyclophilin A)
MFFIGQGQPPRLLSVPLAALALLVACSSPAPKETAKQPAAAAPAHAPGIFRVKFATTKGPFVVEVHRDWAPRGADRFHELIADRFYDGLYFFRVIKGFVVQWGIHKDPRVTARWNSMAIPDDLVKESNRRGTITFATSGPNTRATEPFINLADNRRLDSRGFAPFGKVVEGMDVVDSLYHGYGDGPPQGEGVDQAKAEAQGNEYIEGRFPKLDKILTARLVASGAAGPADR